MQRFAGDLPAASELLRSGADPTRVIGLMGGAAWLLDLYWRWMDHDGDPTDAVGMDDILDTIDWYWLNGTAASSARIYWERMRTFKEREIAAPVAFSQFPRDLHMASRRWMQERYPTLMYYNEVEKGGHYPAMEQPEMFADELRKGFRGVR
jgi:pimeloyl-ACP methyl ester carboxylesterase